MNTTLFIILALAAVVAVSIAVAVRSNGATKKPRGGVGGSGGRSGRPDQDVEI